MAGKQIASTINIQWCSYAKSIKDGKRDMSKKGQKLKVSLSNEELNEVIDYENMMQQMEAALEHLCKQYTEQLSLRTSVNVFDGLLVDTPDGQFPLIQLAQVIYAACSVSSAGITLYCICQKRHITHCRAVFYIVFVSIHSVGRITLYK